MKELDQGLKYLGFFLKPKITGTVIGYGYWKSWKKYYKPRAIDGYLGLVG
jgi:hypothetical protein